MDDTHVCEAWLPAADYGSVPGWRKKPPGTRIGGVPGGLRVPRCLDV